MTKELKATFKTKIVYRMQVKHNHGDMWHDRTYDSLSELKSGANSILADKGEVRNIVEEETKIIDTLS